MKVRIFLIPLSIAFSNQKILGFLFLRKINLQKIVGKNRKLYMNGTVPWKFLAFLKV